MKPIRYAVSLVLYNPKNKTEFLVVKRPKGDVEFPDVWGLPATTLEAGELPEHGVNRCGNEKLSCKIAATEFIGAMVQERKDYILCMMDFKARIVNGEPDVSKANTRRIFNKNPSVMENLRSSPITKGTKYVDQKWTSHPEELMSECEAGSCCTQVFLNHLGLWPREKFITRL